MIVDNRIVQICHAVYTDQPPGTKWYLLEHGTILQLKDVPQVTDEYVIGAMAKLAADLGPFSGEGSHFGDCSAMKLNKFPGWLVQFAFGGIWTYVGPEELEDVPRDAYSPSEVMTVSGKAFRTSELPIEMLDMRVALFGRYKRNLDARNPKIIKRSTEA
jgi:hypothetical protein